MTATPAPIRTNRREVVRDGLRLTLLGLGVGLLLATGVAALLRGMLFGVSPFDPATFGLIILTLLTTAFVACYLPARRAAAIDPLEALRSE